MSTAEEERAAAREFILARLAICRGAIATAALELDGALALFLDPSDDLKGKKRTEAIEAIDALVGEAARAVQAAMPALGDYDPEEVDPEEDDEEEDDDDDEEE